MRAINEIDPLSGFIPPARAVELGSITDAFADKVGSMTIREIKALERLLTSTYLAGREDETDG